MTPQGPGDCKALKQPMGDPQSLHHGCSRGIRVGRAEGRRTGQGSLHRQQPPQCPARGPCPSLRPSPHSLRSCVAGCDLTTLHSCTVHQLLPPFSVQMVRGSVEPATDQSQGDATPRGSQSSNRPESSLRGTHRSVSVTFCTCRHVRPAQGPHGQREGSGNGLPSSTPRRPHPPGSEGGECARGSVGHTPPRAVSGAPADTPGRDSSKRLVRAALFSLLWKPVPHPC